MKIISLLWAFLFFFVPTGIEMTYKGEAKVRWKPEGGNQIRKANETYLAIKCIIFGGTRENSAAPGSILVFYFLIFCSSLQMGKTNLKSRKEVTCFHSPGSCQQIFHAASKAYMVAFVILLRQWSIDHGNSTTFLRFHLPLCQSSILIASHFQG